MNEQQKKSSTATALGVAALEALPEYSQVRDMLRDDLKDFRAGKMTDAQARIFVADHRNHIKLVEHKISAMKVVASSVVARLRGGDKE